MRSPRSSQKMQKTHTPAGPVPRGPRVTPLPPLQPPRTPPPAPSSGPPCAHPPPSLHAPPRLVLQLTRRPLGSASGTALCADGPTTGLRPSPQTRRCSHGTEAGPKASCSLVHCLWAPQGDGRPQGQGPRGSRPLPHPRCHRDGWPTAGAQQVGESATGLQGAGNGGCGEPRTCLERLGPERGELPRQVTENPATVS